MEAGIIRQELTQDRSSETGPRDRSSARTRTAQALLGSTYPRHYLHSLVLGVIIFATLLAAWVGSRDVFGGGPVAEPAGEQSASEPSREHTVPLTTSEAAIRPMEALVASLAPEEPEPAPETPPPVLAAAAEPESEDASLSQAPPEPEPAPEPIFAAGDMPAQDAADQLQPPPPPESVPAESQPEPAPAFALADVPSVRVTAVGDSVMLAAASDLALAISGIEVNAEVGRPVSVAIDVLRTLRYAGELGEIVVVHIGNNSPFTADQFDQMMGLLADVSRVVFVNLKVPLDWEGPNNAVLAAGVARYPNALLADWYTASVDHPQFFLDGVHLRPEGALAYAQLVATLVRTP